MRTVSRIIRAIEDRIPEVRQMLKALYPYTEKAYVIGITGAPGVGKSTLIDKMLIHLRNQNKTVGVLTIDPTSPFSGGAILGDRIGMQRHSMDPGDIFVINKADKRGASKTIMDLELMIETNPQKYREGNWKPKIIAAEAIMDTGVTELLQEIENHRIYLVQAETSSTLNLKKERIREELAEMVRIRIVDTVLTV